MDAQIRSLTSTWNPEHQKRLFRNREFAIATVTTQPFTKSNDDTAALSPGILSSRDGHLRNKICPACRQIDNIVNDLLVEAQAKGQMRPYHIALDYTLHQVHISAELGCHMCAVLEVSTLNYIRNGKPSAFEFEAETAEDSWLWLTTNASRMDEVRCDLKMGLINCEVMNDTAGELSFTPKREFDDALCNGGVQRTSDNVTTDTGDEATFRILENLLRTCRDKHQLCGQVRPPEPNVPRRLLHLGDTMVRVIENIQQFPYVCLSHRWGSQTNVPHKLNKGGQYESFEISSLPKTFQDAIQITKRLGFSHLWIDCFCIVQGSKQDWLEQSAVMAQIYANSVFTIAALSAKDTHGGCFQSRNPLPFQPLYTDHFLVEPRIRDTLWRLEVDGSQPESSPLHTRAWVVQERLSAPRTIFYGSLGVYWECRCMQASENNTKLIDDVTDNTKTMLSKLQAAAEEQNKDLTTKRSSEFLDRWQRLLEVYSICALTYFSDKLIALSGVTRDIEKYSGKQYVHGLWKEDLTTGLLWFHNYSTSNFTRVDDSGRVQNQDFPSWSWASMTGKIQYFNASGEVVWKADVSIVDGTDEKRLKITTWKREVTLDDDNYLVLVDDGSKRGDLQEEYLWYHDKKEPDQQTPLEIVLLQRASASQDRYLMSARCLVVSCVQDNVYRRVGTVTVRYDRPKYDPFPAEPPLAGRNDIVLI